MVIFLLIGLLALLVGWFEFLFVCRVVVVGYVGVVFAGFGGGIVVGRNDVGFIGRMGGGFVCLVVVVSFVGRVFFCVCFVLF